MSRLAGPLRPPSAAKPQRLAVLETAGWQVASPEARQAFKDAVARLASAGIEILTRRSHAQVAAVDDGIVAARPLSTRINAWDRAGRSILIAKGMPAS